MSKRRKQSGALAKFPVNDGSLPEMRQPIAIDSYSNPAARLGMGTTNLAEQSSYPLVRITEDYPLILSLYRGSWIVRRVIETIPDDMLKSFPVLDSEINPDLLKRFEKIVRKTGTLNKLRSAAKWGRLFGGAAAIIVIAGHDDLAQPLELDDIEPGAYKGLIPLDRWSGIIPGPELNQDIEDTVNFGLPIYYNAIMDAGNARIHHSRVLRFIGRELPQWERQVELNWGMSEVELIFDELRKRDYSSWNIVSLLTRAQILSVEEPQLAALMSGAGGSNEAYNNFVRRMESISQLLNNQGLLVLGKDGKLNQNSYTFGGIADVYHEFMKDLSAACQIPYEVIFGRESGLGSNGESGLQLYYDMIEQKRGTDLDPQMDQLIPVIAMSAFGEVPDDLDHHWQPVRSMSDKERAELAKATGDNIVAYFNADLMTKKEAREEIQQSSSTTGLGTNLSDEAVAATPDKYASELGGGEGGMPGMGGPGGMPGGPPGEPGEGEPPKPGGENPQLGAGKPAGGLGGPGEAAGPRGVANEEAPANTPRELTAPAHRPQLGMGGENPFARKPVEDDQTGTSRYQPPAARQHEAPTARQHELPDR
jgi:phage-related protein (TIGR01555 family)